jgi:hypothetical protein
MSNKINDVVLPMGIIIKLKDLGITLIEADYQGSGDSGQIENFTYYSNDDVVDDIPNDVHENIESMFYGQLEYTEDWYNNEGGYGTINFNLNNLSVKIDESIRYTETKDTQYSFYIKPE